MCRARPHPASAQHAGISRTALHCVTGAGSCPTRSYPSAEGSLCGCSALACTCAGYTSSCTTQPRPEGAPGTVVHGPRRDGHLGPGGALQHGQEAPDLGAWREADAAQVLDMGWSWVACAEKTLMNAVQSKMPAQGKCRAWESGRGALMACRPPVTAPVPATSPKHTSSCEGPAAPL